MQLWSFAIGTLVCLQFAASMEVSGAAIGAPEPAQVWTILQFLLRGEHRTILQELYPFVTDLEETEFELDCPDCSLASRVSEVLAAKHGLEDVASLLPVYAGLYPMGLPQYTGETSGDNYFVLNGKRYGKSDDVFYLKSRELEEQAQRADLDVYAGEIVVGTKQDAPIVLLYGCPDGEGDFEEFNRNLYSEASDNGKLRFVWRSTCPLNDSSIKNVAVGLAKRESTDTSVLSAESLKIPAEFRGGALGFEKLNEEELADVDLKVATLLAQHYSENKDFQSTLDYAKGIINNFPLLAKQLAKLQIGTSKVVKSNKKLKLHGIDYGMLGLYVNGQNWRLSEGDKYNLVNAITREYYAIKHLESTLQNYDDVSSLSTAKRLLQKFSDISIPNLEQNQPVKIDLHRIPGFSEAIIYFNDIELDGQYEELGTDVRNFFEESKFGEIPDVRQNWNEVIFAIDFGRLDDEDTKIALEGLNRAIKVIAQGYPQRVGLLPLNTGTGEGHIHKIYQLKHLDLTDLAEFLENLPQVQTASRYPKTPDYSSVVGKLQIKETSLIINGEIYPFKKNTWHYLIARTIKKDKAYLTRELSKIIKPDQRPNQKIDIRGILHARSASKRHGKYTPDYYVDATYTSLNNAALDTIGGSVAEYIKGEKYVVLHTVTLVDDFTTSMALQRLKNLLNTTFYGVRMRIINIGSLDKRSWQDIVKAVKTSDSAKLESLIARCRNEKPQFTSNRQALDQWLVDIKVESLGDTAFLIVNGRFIHLESNEIPTRSEFEAIIKREATRTLDTMHALEQVFPQITADSVDPNFIETISSTLSKLFYHGTNIHNNGIDYTAQGSLPRMNLSLEINNFTVFQSHDVSKPVDVTLFMDPTEERSQNFISSLCFLRQIPFVNFQVVLLPTEDLKIQPIDRIYLDDPKDLKGLGENFKLELDTPSNFVISNTDELDGVIIEVHAFKAGQVISEANIDGIGGVCLELVRTNGEVESTCITMVTFGYGQFIARSWHEEFTVRSCDPRYKVASFAQYGRSDHVRSKTVSLLDLDPLKLHVEITETSLPATQPSDNALHVYTVLRDNAQDETSTKQMIESILSRTPKHRTVKFWILDQPYLSASFREFCTRVSRDSSGSVELIQFAWPPWLRPQTLSDKRLELYKVLFLDVMFPTNVQRIVYLEPNAAPLDPFEIDSHAATPFAMFEATDKGYWQQGYWAKRLQETKKRFHRTGPAFLADLAWLRSSHAGDTLRVHYQRLSADINSLANGSDDLVNDLQSQLPIETLRIAQAVVHDEL